MKSKLLEWFGVITAIIYSMMVALNIGIEFVGFLLLLISAISIGYWAYLGQHRGILAGLNPNNFSSPSIDDIKNIAEELYGNILDDLINKGNTKAIERIYTITKELTEGYNISFKVIKI